MADSAPVSRSEQPGRMFVASSACAFGKVILEIAVMDRAPAKFLDYQFTERRPAQIRVQNHAGRIDDRLQRRRQHTLHISLKPLCQQRRI